MGNNMVTLIGLGVLVLFGGVFLLMTKLKKSPAKSSASTAKNIGNAKSKEVQSAYKKNASADVSKEDIFKFMEFDRIQDDMIIQQNGEKYTAVIKCKGINYNLMSEVEQLSVEEGFINFLNTLKFPIQLYVQAQNVDLKENIKKYRENMKEIHEEFDEMNSEYQLKVNSLEATDEEIEEAEKKRNSVLNVLEYGQDIVKYVERLSLNKSMLQRQFYVLVSYYKSEITNASNFDKEEILDICFTELFTRVQNIMSGLSMCSVAGSILDSNELAELVYSAYNRDDKNYISVKQALEAGFHRLYSTSYDAISKKHHMLLENIRKEAEYKAVEALNKAIEEGNVVSMEDIEDEYDQESSKQAIELIKKEKVSDEVKNKAKKIIVDEYKKAKKERNERKEKMLEESQQALAEEQVTSEDTAVELSADENDSEGEESIV